MTTPYPVEILGEYDDDGTMVSNVAELSGAVIGHRIVSAVRGRFKDEYAYHGESDGFVLTLDNGTEVRMVDTEDCCAVTELETFLLNVSLVDHVITGVGTTEGYRTWHVYADMGDVLELTVGWSPGNPFYYGYGFNITVIEGRLDEFDLLAVE